MIKLATLRELNLSRYRHSSRSLALRRSSTPCCQPLPGSAEGSGYACLQGPPGADVDRVCHAQGYALTPVLVDQRHVLDLLAFCRGVEDEVFSPHGVDLEGCASPQPQWSRLPNAERSPSVPR